VRRTKTNDAWRAKEMLARRSVEEEAQVKEVQDRQDECFWNWLECTEKAMGEALEDGKKRRVG
jgi:hypothetical protein